LNFRRQNLAGEYPLEEKVRALCVVILSPVEHYSGSVGIGEQLENKQAKENVVDSFVILQRDAPSLRCFFECARGEICIGWSVVKIHQQIQEFQKWHFTNLMQAASEL
jgi:hypothetical protein